MKGKHEQKQMERLLWSLLPCRLNAAFSGEMIHNVPVYFWTSSTLILMGLNEDRDSEGMARAPNLAISHTGDCVCDVRLWPEFAFLFSAVLL